MANLNKVMLIGNLTRDPEIKYTPKGTAIAHLGLAVSRVWSNEAGEKQEETTFVDIDFFGRTAEIAGEYLKKGRSVYIEGRLKLDSWDDKQSGQKRSKMKVVGENLQMLGSRESGGASPVSGSGEAGESHAAAGFKKPAPPPQRPPADPDLDAEPDDIPF